MVNLLARITGTIAMLPTLAVNFAIHIVLMDMARFEQRRHNHK